ncbi:MAG TPA: TonB-dependent receptor [Chitinophagaceae bacterium]
MLKRKLLLLAIFFCAGISLTAQVTTSSITGIVKNKAGEPLAGASISATHVPTGTTYKTIARNGGRFEISNMNPGGPYTVQATFVGMSPEIKSDITLNLGESVQVDFELLESKNELSNVVVTGARQAAKNGTETTIGRDKMENLPTVGRTLADYLRATPQIRISSGGQISSEGAMSFAGQNVRYNSFYVDGAVNNDVFGLAYSGTNGGQSGIAPLSIDAIDQFQVSISPYNASLGNFTGAAINAITKSGTNELHGSGYYIFRNENLSGKTPTGLKKDAIKMPSFSNKTFGITLGGPIVKNKIFYFVSAEIQRDQTPSIFTLKDYQGTTKDPALIQRLVDTIRIRSNGFNVGGYTNNVNETNAERITGKIDWNLSDKNKLSLSYRYTHGDRLVPLDNGPTLLRFETNGYRFPTTTHSASAELKTSFSKNMSNRLLLTFTNVEDDRAPLGSGNPMPLVQIFDGPVASINFGTEANSTFNYLKQNTYNIVEQFKFNLGKNNFTVGAEAESYKAFNSFISNTAGNYRYDSLQAFFNNSAPNQYIVNYPLLGSTDEKTTKSAAEFNIFKGAAFINDEIRATKDLTIVLGLRADYYKFPTSPISDRFAIDSAMPKFALYHDLKGGMPGLAPTIPVSISPRAGFTYQLPEEKITIRGGFGWFAGRIPLVWPSAIYNNNGLSQGGYTLSSSQNAGLRSLIKYRTTPYTPSEIGLTVADAKGTLVITSKEFKMPKVFRTSLAVDKRFGKGWLTTFEVLYTRNVNDVYYRNINLLPPTLRMVSGPDTRNVYPTSNTIPIRSNGTNPYQAAYLLYNAPGEKPFSYNFTASISKTSSTLNMSLSYNYGESFVLNEAQSSTPGSQWNSMETVNGRNALVLTNSDNSVGHRIFGYVSKKFIYANKKVSTTVSLTYTGQSGQPFSYVYSGSTPPIRDGQTNNDLVFIPTAEQLQAMTFVATPFSGVTYTDVQQKAAFETFIQNDKYLRTHRGQYAERNGSRIPFSHIIDLKIAQGFHITVGKKKYTAEVAYSMFNFTNFLNRDWGRQYVVNFDNYGLLGFSYTNAATNLTPRYTFNPNTPKAETVYNRFNPTYTARWLSQLEFRIKF